MDTPAVGHLMSSPVATVTPETPMYEAAETMLSRSIGSLVVVEDGHPEGILTTTDCVALVAARDSTDQTRVEEYVTTDIVTVTTGDTIREAAHTMMDHGIHHLPVVNDDGEVAGIVTTTDLTAYLSPEWTPDRS